MENQFKVKIYDTLKDIYKYSNFDRNPVSDDFDIFPISETYPNVQKMLSPHRRNFFTVIFFESQQDGQLKIDANKHSGLHNAILFQSHEHIFSFVRGKNMKGYILLFKQSFLLPIVSDVISDFTFFSSLKNNLYHLNAKENKEFIHLIQTIIAEQKNKSVSKYLLLAFLQKCSVLQQQYQNEEKVIPKSFQLVRQFQQQINNHFLEKKSVDFYARVLHITPSHLNETIKTQTGKTAKQHISERILLEAKKLLLYSDMDIASISHYLDFSEPSHFGKFFKKETSQTPVQFRQQP